MLPQKPLQRRITHARLRDSGPARPAAPPTGPEIARDTANASSRRDVELRATTTVRPGQQVLDMPPDKRLAGRAELRRENRKLRRH
jgi:hypothetical protein